MRNKRLQAIADCVIQDCIMADIGTDHAYLPCELIRSSKAVKCYACDIAEGPLNSAKATIEQERMQDKIVPILCPGLKDVPSDANVAVIAGMGWMTCKIILEEDFNKLSQFDQVLIQVNRDVAHLRSWLMEHQFEIELEKVVHDRLFYTIIGFNPKHKKHVVLNQEEILFGPMLLKHPDQDCLDYFQFLYNQNETILQKMNRDSNKANHLKWQNEILKKQLDYAG